MANQTRDQKLEGLLSSAAREFALRGYDRTSMRDLARSSGVSLAGVYYYVQSKEELLFLIQSRNFEAVISGMRDALPRLGNCRGRSVRHGCDPPPMLRSGRRGFASA